MNLSAKTLLPLLLVAGTVYLLWRVQDVLLPFVLGATLAYLLNPLVKFFEIRGVKRGPVVVFVYLALAGGLSLATYRGVQVAASEAQKAAELMPSYVEKGEKVFSQHRLKARNPERLSTVERLAYREAFFDYVAEHGRAWPEKILQRMPSFASGLLPLLEIAFLAPFIAFFLMREGPGWRDQLLELVPARYVEMVLNILVDVDNSLGKYVRGICLEASFVGVLAFVGFWIIDLDYALQIAIIVGLANVVPYVGPIVGGLLGSAVALFQWGGPGGVLAVIAVCAAVRFIEDWFIQPLVLQNAMHLHPLLIIFSLMAGAKLFGFWGLLFGVPVACMAKVLITVLWQWYRSQYGLRYAPPAHAVSHLPLI